MLSPNHHSPMKTIIIETAANGYIANDGARDFGMAAPRNPHVFETFGGLTQWLSQQLEKPKVPETVAAYPEETRRALAQS
jgi:hypothetical protein